MYKRILLKVCSLSFLSLTILTGCSSPIQKRVNVLESVGAAKQTFGRQDPKFVSRKCYETFIDQSKLDNLLSKGVKVISSSKVQTPVRYIGPAGFDLSGACSGTTYILEGTKSKFDSL